MKLCYKYWSVFGNGGRGPHQAAKQRHKKRQSLGIKARAL